MTASSMPLFGATRPTLIQRAPPVGVRRCAPAPAAALGVGSIAAGGTTAVCANPAAVSSASLKDDTASPSDARGASARSSCWASS